MCRIVVETLLHVGHGGTFVKRTVFAPLLFIGYRRLPPLGEPGDDLAVTRGPQQPLPVHLLLRRAVPDQLGLGVGLRLEMCQVQVVVEQGVGIAQPARMHHETLGDIVA